MVKQIINRYQQQKLSWPKDWFIKFISVLFAVFLWYFVAGEDRVDMNVQIPVEIVNLPRELVISNQFRNQLDVTVSGPRGMIRKLSQQGISRSIDLSDASPGNIVLDNAPDSINLPQGIHALRISPSQIVLLVDRLVKRTIPIEYATKGKIPSDYELDSIKLEPDTLTLSGPQQLLKSTVSLKTQIIDISKLKSSSVKQVALDLPQDVADLIGESVVTASIKIKDKLVTKKIRRIPISIKGSVANQEIKLSPAKAKITAQVPKAIIRETKDLSTLFELFVTAESLADGTHEKKIEVKTSPRITVDAVDPEEVKVTIKTLRPETNQTKSE